MAQANTMKVKKPKENEVSAARKSKHGTALTVFFSVLSFLWILPILIVVLN